MRISGLSCVHVRYEVPLSALPKGIDPSKLTMKATLYYQSIPPYYLMQRFDPPSTPLPSSRAPQVASAVRWSQPSVRPAIEPSVSTGHPQKEWRRWT
jgi:hypothetical protein